MPPANRHDLPGSIWHITHRCHQQAFLLTLSRDRRLCQRWLFEARRRYGLQVLDYMITGNHIHLLVRDRGEREIPRAMALIAGKTAQTFNGRKHRRGAFWEEHYHATTVESGERLRHCLVYIDLNMVRAGRVAHPSEWDTCGYQEIQRPRTRYRIVDSAALMDAVGIDDPQVLKKAHRHWVEEALRFPAPRQQEFRGPAPAMDGHSFRKRLRSARKPLHWLPRIEPAGASLRVQEEPVSYSARFDTENEGSSN